MTTSLKAALATLPAGLLAPLLKEYEGAIEAAQSGKWETVGLKAGKLCEIIYSILKGHIDGAFPPKPSKPQNMLAACAALEQADKTKFSRAIRIQIPRLLIAVYELRNNRDIGHVGGEVDPNEMDGLLFLQSIKWLVAELVRAFHAIDITQAKEIVEAVSERTFPLIWEGDGKYRVLNPNLDTKDKVLVLLYHVAGKLDRHRILEAVEYSNPSVFKKKVLGALHKAALIDFNMKDDTARILPPGMKHVEEKLLREI